MARILMTGMCSAQDLRVFHSDASRIFFRPFAPKIESYSDLMKMFSAAGNTGNYLISEGAYWTLKDHDVDYLPFWYVLQWIENSDFQKLILEHYSFCVFVTANILHQDYNLVNELKVLEGMPMPIIFMSVGVQRVSALADLLSPSSVRFIEFLKGTDSVVFTRGAFAGEFLRQQGVRNVFDACCPSAFYQSEQILSGVRRLKECQISELHEVWVNGYLGDGQCALADIGLFRTLARHVNYVLQDEPSLFGVLDQFSEEPMLYNDGTGLLLKKPKNLGTNTSEAYAFFSTEQWRARASAVDLLFGRRFHGNLVGLQAGRPAIFIAHDDRVLEMVESIGVPYIRSEEWEHAEDKRDFLSKFVHSVDVTRFENHYCEKRAQFLERIKSLFG
jgi:hypothetical protein